MIGSTRAMRGILFAVVALLASTGLIGAVSAPASAENYPQDGWHGGSAWNEGSTRSSTVIDCASMIIANMGTGQIATPGAGIIAGMGVEVDLNGAHPKTGESFYIHIWGRSVGTPCGGEGFIPIFSLPPGVTLDTSKAVLCFSDGAAVTGVTCPQPNQAGAKFQSAQNETGNANSWKILCGYASGCLGYAWPAAFGHGFEFGLPVKASTTFNAAKVGGGAWIVDAYRNSLMPLTAPLNVFAGSAGNGTPPASLPVVGGGTIPDPGTAYRIVYENPSTYASPKFPHNAALTTTHGIVSTATAYTNGVKGFFVIARDSSATQLASLSSSLQTLSDQTDHIGAAGIPVNQFTYGVVGSGGGASYQVDYDWGDTDLSAGNVWGTDPAAFVPGTTYYWKLGFAPTPNGDSDISTAKVTWGAVQSFTAPAAVSLTCNNKPVTVSIGLGQQPTDGDDVILGTADSDSINGGLGNDTICGLGGNDLLVGGPGNDNIFGGSGDDLLLPGAGTDGAYGEDGTDTVSYADLDTPVTLGDDPQGGVTYNPNGCSSGFVVVCGAAGIDTLSAPGKGLLPERFVGSRFDDQITVGVPTSPSMGGRTVLAFGGDGNDILNGSADGETLVGGTGQDLVNGWGGNDTIDVRDSVTDTVNCGDGSDTVTADRVDALTACEKALYPPMAMPSSWISHWPAKAGKVKKAKVRKTLKVSALVLSASGKSQHPKVTYQWYVGGKPAKGATSTTFKVKKSHKDKAITVTTRVSKAQYVAVNRSISFGKAR